MMSDNLIEFPSCELEKRGRTWTELIGGTMSSISCFSDVGDRCDLIAAHEISQYSLSMLYGVIYLFINT